MRLDEVAIGNFKNLRDLRIDFDRKSPYTVLVGENGAGKSNLLEAVTLIFKALDLQTQAPFDFSLRYRCRAHDIRIVATKNEMPRVSVREDEDAEYVDLSRREFAEEDERGPVYRPAFVFGYYSGPGDRLSSLYEEHRTRYYKELIKAPERRRTSDPNSLRRLFYAETLHGQFALLAFFMASGSDAEERPRVSSRIPPDRGAG